MADIAVNRTGKVLEITLNRPEKMNALSPDMRRGLLATLQSAEHSYREKENPDVRAVILTGAGAGFCSGADLDPDSILPRRATIGQELDTQTNQLVRTLRSLPVPVIAAVNGPAAGAGVGLALASDIILASATARFHLAFARIGAVMDAGTSYFLTRTLGAFRTRAMALTGGAFTAQVGEAWGVVHELHPPEDLMPAARQLAARLADGPAGALAQIKTQIDIAQQLDLAQVLDSEAHQQARAFNSADFETAIRAHAKGQRAFFNADTKERDT